MTNTAADESRRTLLAKRLASYAVAAGAGLCAAQQAEAGLMNWTPTKEGSLTLQSGEEFRVDLNQDGHDDYVIDALTHNYLGAVFQISGLTTDGVQNLLFPSAHAYNSMVSYVGLINYGGAVGPADDSWVRDGILFDTLSKTPSGEFLDQRGWVGLFFEIPGSSPHYGVLDVEEAQGELIIHGGVFESEPNAPIGSVPEPTAFTLWALGATGILTWRKRRRQNSDAADGAS
jgi:hypothetical protein